MSHNPQPAVRKSANAAHQPRRRGKLPCGARECVHCHKGCGVAMAAYLSGLDELPAKDDAERGKEHPEK